MPIPTKSPSKSPTFDSGSSRTKSTVFKNGRHVEQIAGGNLDQIDQTHVILPGTVGALVQRGDTLQFTFLGATRTRTAGTIVNSAGPITGRVRVDLEDA